jgi:phosphoribulokinase
MSIKHPIIAITGSSGAGTTSVKKTFDQSFRREKINAGYIEGEAFDGWTRAGMRGQMKEAAARGDHHYSHFGEAANLFHELEKTFRDYSETGICRARTYIHDADEAEIHRAPPVTFTPWRDFEPGSDLLFYEGLHGAVVTDTINVAQYVDLKIGVVPVINLEWIQKLHRDASRGYTTERPTDRHINYICPQSSHGHQLPASADRRHQSVRRALDPDARRSMVVIRFRDPLASIFPSSLDDHNNCMSRANSIVIPGGKLDIAMQLILTPMILKLAERGRRALRT